MLRVTNVSCNYGKTPILHNVSLEVREGEIVSIIGRNGVGKTTLLETIMGLVRCGEGTITYKERDITSFPPYERARLGMSYVPQGREIFPELTVQQNLRVAGEALRGYEPDSIPRVLESFPAIKERTSQKGKTLSGGEQQMLAIARALITKPNLILLDEPTTGLQPTMVSQIGKTLNEITKASLLTVLLVEQNLDFAASLASRFYIMERGSLVKETTPDEVKKDEIIKEFLAL